LHEALVKRVCGAVDASLVVQIVGSFRRGAAASGDVDVLLMHPSWTRATQKANGKGKGAKSVVADVVDALMREGYVFETLANGIAKFAGVCRLNDEAPVRRLDIKLFPTESFPCALLHFTGSAELNRQLRSVALSRRLTLSEFGMQAVGLSGEKSDWLDIRSEEDVFRLLHVPCLAPNQRSL